MKKQLRLVDVMVFGLLSEATINKKPTKNYKCPTWIGFGEDS